jgi:hypothetical protein
MNSPAGGVKWERGKFPDNQFAVAERRSKAARGETVGVNAQTNKAPEGAKETSVGDFAPPQPGLEIFGWPNPRFHRGLLCAAPPAPGPGPADVEATQNGSSPSRFS